MRAFHPPTGAGSMPGAAPGAARRQPPGRAPPANRHPSRGATGTPTAKRCRLLSVASTVPPPRGPPRGPDAEGTRRGGSGVSRRHAHRYGRRERLGAFASAAPASCRKQGPDFGRPTPTRRSLALGYDYDFIPTPPPRPPRRTPVAPRRTAGARRPGCCGMVCQGHGHDRSSALSEVNGSWRPCEIRPTWRRPHARRPRRDARVHGVSDYRARWLKVKLLGGGRTTFAAVDVPPRGNPS